MTAVLSTRDGAGLYLARRARSLVGPHQLRLLGTAFVGLLLVDLARLSLGHAGSHDSVSWAGVGSEALVYAAIVLLLWRPGAGLVLAAISLVAAELNGGTGTEPLLLLVSGLFAFTRTVRRVRLGYGVGVVVYVLALAAAHRDHLGFVVFWLGGAAVVGAGVGELVGRLRSRWGATGEEEATLVAETARLRHDERRLLTRELHDVVTHQLSTVSLQVMGQQDSTDAEQLRRTLKKIGVASDAALTELRLLVRVLRDDSATAAGADEVAELTQRVTPTATAAEWTRRLTTAGFDPDVEVPARADRLGMTVQRTLVRAIEAAGANVLRHAAPRTSCSVAIVLNASQVVLRVASQARTPATSASLGWGLSGLRERVLLTGGTFAAGPVGDEWVVVVTVPLD